MAPIEHPQSRLIRPFWRAVLAGISIALAYIVVLAEQVERGIRGYYFKDYSLRLPPASELLLALVAFYLLLVAFTGKWRLRSK